MLNKLHKRGRQFILALILIGILLLSSCARVNCDCPVYPVAGPKVAEELEKASTEDFPKTWEWIARINKLREELEQL